MDKRELVKTVVINGKKIEIDGYYNERTPKGRYEWYDIFYRGECLNLGEPFATIPSKKLLEKIVAHWETLGIKSSRKKVAKKSKRQPVATRGTVQAVMRFLEFEEQHGMSRDKFEVVPVQVGKSCEGDAYSDSNGFQYKVYVKQPVAKRCKK